MPPPKPDRKILVVILDGLGDLPIAAFDGATPLEAAATPVLDRWVTDGICGLVDPVAPGVCVETHAGTGALMGLSTEQVGTLARGPIEAAGAGLELVEGDIALRCNFATLERDGDALAVRDRRAGRIREGMADLALAVNAIPPHDGVTTFLEPLSQHRAVLRLSGPELSGAISDTDPGVGARPQTLQWSRATEAGDSRAQRTAAALNRFLRRAHELLRAHALNAQRASRGLPAASGLLTRGAGAFQPLVGFTTRVGLRGAVVGADRTVLGLGSLLGFTPVVETAFTGLLDTDLDAKIASAAGALETHDVVWLHVKGTDIAAHDCHPEAKRDILQRIDTALGAVDEELVIAVTADHTTDSNTGRHTSDPVPTLLRVPGGRRDDCTAFGERTCMHGGLGRLSAAQFLRVVLGAAGPMAEPTRRTELDAASEAGDTHPDPTRSQED